MSVLMFRLRCTLAT